MSNPYIISWKDGTITYQCKMDNKIKTINKEKCKFCGSTELVYHQYIINDSSCKECGEWQNGETI